MKGETQTKFLKNEERGNIAYYMQKISEKLDTAKKAITDQKGLMKVARIEKETSEAFDEYFKQIKENIPNLKLLAQDDSGSSSSKKRHQKLFCDSKTDETINSD